MKIGDVGMDHSFLLDRESISLIDKIKQITWKDVVGWLVVASIVATIVINLPVF